MVDTKFGLMTLQQIADKAGVSRTAVSNWRNRHADFPEVAPESSTRRPLFVADEVDEWLAQRGIVVEAHRSAEAVAADMVQSSRLLGEDVTPVVAVALGVLAACRSARQGQANSDPAKRFAEATEPRAILLAAADLLDAESLPSGDAEALSNALRYLVTDANESFVPELRNVVLAEAHIDFPRLTELVMEEAFARRGSGLRGDLGHPASASSQLLAEAAATSLPNDAGTLLDPVCGTGDTLLRLATLVPGDARVYGNEIEPVLADIARIRLWLHGTNAVISNGNALSDSVLESVAADVVVAEPPIGLRLKDLTAHEASPRDFWGVQGGLSGDAAFAIDAASRLAPGGRAYLLVPATLLTSTSQNRLREQLMARGMIEAIIEFPRKLLTYTAVATALLVLRGDHAEAIGVETTLIDATSRMPNGYTVAGWLRSVRGGHEPSGSSVKVGTIGLTEIISGDTSLLPSARLATPLTPDQALSAKDDARQLFDATLEDLDDAAIDWAQEAGLASTMDAQRVTLVDLIDSGEVRLVRCHGGAEIHNDTVPSAEVYPITEADVKAVPGTGKKQMRRVEMGTDFETLLEGDIILPLAGKRDAFEMPIGKEDNAIALGHAVRGLRIENNERIDAEYLIWCLNAPTNAPASTTHGVPRRALRDITIPLIPLSEQKRTVRHLDALKAVQNQAAKTQIASEKLISATLDWLPFS